MNHITYTLWLVEESFSVMTYFWPITLVLSLFLVAASLKSSPLIWSCFQLRDWIMVLPLVGPVLILACGSLLRHGGQEYPGSSWPGYLVLSLVIVQLLVAVGVVCALKGRRWLAVAAVSLQQWMGFACAIVSGMSVTGDWL